MFLLYKKIAVFAGVACLIYFNITFAQNKATSTHEFVKGDDELTKLKTLIEIQKKLDADEIFRRTLSQQDIIDLLHTVYMTRKCPTDKTKIESLKTLAARWYKERKHVRTPTRELKVRNGKSPFFCGYNSSEQSWVDGKISSDSSGNIMTTEDDGNVTIFKVAEPGIYQFISDDDKNISYRDNGDMGDSVFFKVAPGLFFQAAVYIQNQVIFKSEGFYANYLIFTPDFFKEKFPALSKSDRKKLMDRKSTLKTQPLHVSSKNTLNPATYKLPSVPAEPKQSLPLVKGGALDVLKRPVLTQSQLDDVFRKNRKVMFSVIWNKDTMDPNAITSGGENQMLSLAQHKIFALAFADLYMINRNQLDAAATQILDDDENVIVKIYFRRRDTDLDSFGYVDKSTKGSETECMEDFKKGPEYAQVQCFPLIIITLSLQKNGQEISFWKSQSLNIPYGYGTGQSIVTAQQIVNEMVNLKNAQ